MMKISKPLTIFLFLFVISSLATCTFSSLSDGNNTMGFPITFYMYLGGKRFPEPETRILFSWSLLLLDLIILFVVAYGLSYLLKKKKDKVTGTSISSSWCYKK